MKKVPFFAWNVLVLFLPLLHAATAPSIDHIVTASGFGGYAGIASPGSWIEIYGLSLSGTTRSWAEADFSGAVAPTTLDGVSVTIGGVPAYLSYISPTQINLQVPDAVAVGDAAVVVTYQGTAGAPASLNIKALQPGLLAPSSFSVNGKQYVVALHGADNTFIGNGTITGIPSSPAVSGETILFYGVGFGAVSPPGVAGKKASTAAPMTNNFAMTVGGQNAAVTFAGLAPGLVGLYQFNVTQPAVAATGDALVQASVNGALLLQSLYLPVKGVAAAPSGVSATAGNTTAAVSFTPSGAAQYTVTCTAAGFTKTASGANSPILVAGLTNGVTYTCSVSGSAGVTVTPLLAYSSAYNTLWIPDTITGTTFNLTLAPATKQILPDEVTKTYSYNNSGFWGPTLIMNQGDTVQMNVTNNLSEATTTHWHGFHIPPSTDGGPHQPIAVGETWTPSFTVKNNAATYWYHPHLHMKTAEQLLYGSGGFIIVKDPVEAALPLPRTYGIDDLPLVLTSRSFLAGGNQIKTDVSMSPYGDNMLTNGTLNARTTLPAQFVRLRILNAEIERAYNLGFGDGRTFYVIGNDGGLLDAPVPVTRLRVFVGERYEILVDLSRDAVGAQLDLKAYNSGLTFGFPGGEPATSGNFGSLLNNTTFNVLRINVGAQTGSPVTSLPATLVKNTYLTSSDAVKTRTVQITDKGPGTPFNFDSVAYNPDTISQTVTLGAAEAWTISNGRTFSHSFHIHDVQFKIVSRSSGTIAAYEQGWKDTVSVPINESVTFVARFDDFSDVVNPYMYHCHFSNHEDEGMMGQFIVIRQ
jgi:blue copper oxidase